MSIQLRLSPVATRLYCPTKQGCFRHAFLLVNKLALFLCHELRVASSEKHFFLANASDFVMFCFVSFGWKWMSAVACRRRFHIRA